MSHVIAIAGKGGTGKTTIASLIIKIIKDKKLGSILAVDADPNSNLGEVLGVKIKETIGNILDDIAEHPEEISVSMPKNRLIEYKVQEAVYEANGFDILSMGRPEGPGCYCYVNNVLRDAIGKLIDDYDYVIIDNEAGLEHLSRRTTRKADIFLIISDPTQVGLKAARRIAELIRELKIKSDRKLLLINRYEEEVAESQLNNLDLEYLGKIPEDKEIKKMSFNGVNILGLENKSAALIALTKLGDKIWG
jgi:CO dehydrogenase maturation factor